MKSKKLKILVIVIASIVALGVIAAIFDSGDTGTNDDTSAAEGSTQTEKWVNKPATEGLQYSLNEDKESYGVSGIGDATEKDIVIDTAFQGKPVTKIHGSAFSGCEQIESVFIPDTVVAIGMEAFRGCTGLKAVQMAPSVKTIYEWAFSGCASLSDCSIPTSVSKIKRDAFAGCTKLLQTENGVSYVGKWLVAFDNNSTDVTVKEGTVGIADRAFYNNSFAGESNLESIVFPSSIKYIVGDAFEGCSLSEIYVNDISAWCQVDMDNGPVNYETPVTIYLDGKKVGEEIKELVIPDGVKRISAVVFSGWHIDSMSVPASVVVFLDFPSGCHTVNYAGTTEQWDKIERYKYKFEGCTVNCSDGIGDNTYDTQTQE